MGQDEFRFLRPFHRVFSKWQLVFFDETSFHLFSRGGDKVLRPRNCPQIAALDTASLFSFGAAFRLSSLRYDLLRLIRANQTLCQERFGRLATAETYWP